MNAVTGHLIRCFFMWGRRSPRNNENLGVKRLNGKDRAFVSAPL